MCAEKKKKKKKDNKTFVLLAGETARAVHQHTSWLEQLEASTKQGQLDGNPAVRDGRHRHRQGKKSKIDGTKKK